MGVETSFSFSVLRKSNVPTEGCVRKPRPNEQEPETKTAVVCDSDESRHDRRMRGARSVVRVVRWCWSDVEWKQCRW